VLASVPFSVVFLKLIYWTAVDVVALQEEHDTGISINDNTNITGTSAYKASFLLLQLLLFIYVYVFNTNSHKVLMNIPEKC